VDYQKSTLPPQNGLIVILGEAPGANEVKFGKPFIGRSGQLLDKNLIAVGIDRQTCMIANVFRYQPPQNKVGHFFLSKRKSIESGEAIASEWGKFACGYCRSVFASELQHLKDTLLKLKPAVMITLGRTPLWAVSGLEGLTKIRGQHVPNRVVPEIPIIATFHPSFIIRGNWALEKDFQADLQKAADLAKKST
jgi:DNA polymerase